jgi:hypothetical protein
MKGSKKAALHPPLFSIPGERGFSGEGKEWWWGE